MTVKPAAMHEIACVTLSKFGRCLSRHEWAETPRRNNRIVFERILFVAFDQLRTHDALNVPVQAQFDAPSQLGWLTLPTIDTLLAQCVEEGWMVEPSAVSTSNFELTGAGSEIAQRFVEATENQSAIERITGVLAKFEQSEFSLRAIQDTILTIAVDSRRTITPYPYYRTDAPALAPYIRGALQRG